MTIGATNPDVFYEINERPVRYRYCEFCPLLATQTLVATSAKEGNFPAWLTVSNEFLLLAFQGFIQNRSGEFRRFLGIRDAEVQQYWPLPGIEEEVVWTSFLVQAKNGAKVVFRSQGEGGIKVLECYF